jgi:hypothetical protein
MNAADKLAQIVEALKSGRTIYVRTMTRATKVQPKHLAQFDAIGRPLFKVAGNSLFMSSGKRYDCIDYCGITFA